MILEWLVLAAMPAVGFLLLFLVLGRWGKKRDPMGGTPGHIWEPDAPRRKRRKG